MSSSSSSASSSSAPPPQYSSLPSPSSSNSTVPHFISRPTTVSNPVFPTRRPPEEVFALYSFTRPCSLGEARLRMKRNLTHFRVNYFKNVLCVVGISLMWHHPTSIMVLLVTLVPWFFLYFYRDKPLVLFGRAVDVGAVEAALSVVTVVAVGLTGVWVNVLVSIFVGVVLVGLHAAFRSTEDLYADEHEGYGGGLLSSFVGGTPTNCA